MNVNLPFGLWRQIRGKLLSEQPARVQTGVRPNATDRKARCQAMLLAGDERTNFVRFSYLRAL
jgi:hypothetical protein